MTRRPVILATAAAPAVAQRIADHLGLFDEVLSSSETANLSGARKAETLVARFGERGFDYIGNHRDDLPVLRHARFGYMVGATGTAQTGQVWIRAPAPRLRLWTEALRAHQWVKNGLIFVPLLTAQEADDVGALVAALLAFVSYSLLASAAYLVNDLLDLPADRLHRSKRARPFAAGTLPIAFMAVLATYAICTTLYSFWLKRRVGVDVMLLAGLYTLRILAGAAATDIAPSFWLLTYAMFVFLCLAMLKRYSELRVAVQQEQELAGRGYLSADLPVVLAIGTGTGLVSVLILALYTQSETVFEHYPVPQWLWLVPPLMLHWVVRIWIKANRGEVHDDPVLFCVKDRQSLVTFAGVTAMFFLAGVGWRPW